MMIDDFIIVCLLIEISFKSHEIPNFLHDAKANFFVIDDNNSNFIESIFSQIRAFLGK